MSQLATIFEKIKEDFFESLTLDENKEQFKLIFAPFSTGFTNDDFLFLDTNNASDQVKKYYDELYEFSQIANTIPYHDNFWTTSDNSNDYLFNKYKTILQSLRLIDAQTLTIEMLYGQPIFNKAIEAIDADLTDTYKSFYNLYQNLKKEIEDLKDEITDDATQYIQIEIKEQNLKTVKEQWDTDENKTIVETKILEILKDEINRFIQKLTETKTNFETAIRTHPGNDFYLTYCMPNNLYQEEGLTLKKIKINQQDINRLLKKESIATYNSLFENANETVEIEHIEFELIFVDVTRSWFDDNLLESPFWDINILNKNEIEIPSFTNKLIFIRDVDIKLKENSVKNAAFLKLCTQKSLGPFVINPLLLKQGKSLQLKSVNTALNLKRETILNVASKINTKSKNTNQNIVLKKQQQFVKLAPKLKEREVVLAKMVKPKTTNLFSVKAISALKTSRITTLFKNLKTAKYEFSFIDAKTNRQVFVEPEHITILKNNNSTTTTTKLQKNNDGNLSCALALNTAYQFNIKKNSYATKTHEFKTNSQVNDAKNPIKLTIVLSRSESELPKEDKILQLIGVISKTVQPYPNPIKQADYI